MPGYTLNYLLLYPHEIDVTGGAVIIGVAYINPVFVTAYRDRQEPFG
jgi:hypothetical protein